MKKFSKCMRKTLSVFLTMIMVMAIFTVAPLSASAASCVKTQAEAVSWLKSQGGATYNLDTSTSGTQCVEFVKAYVNWLLTGNAWKDSWNRATGNGIDVWKNSLWSELGWQVYTNTASFVPQPGDIFSSGTSGYGHTGVVISSDVYTATVAEANVDSPYNGTPVKVHTITWRSSSSNSPYGATHFIRPSFNNNHTHNYNTYVYYWKAHPHYNCYKCSCGDIKENRSETNYVSTCSDCVGVSSAWIKSDKTSLATGDSITFTFGATNAVHYSMGIDKDGERIISQNVTSGQSFTFDEAGNYSVYVTCYNESRNRHMDTPKITFTVFKPLNLGESFYANITNSKAGKNISVNEEENVLLESKKDNDSQKWLFELQSDNSYKITNVKYNKCLNVDGGSTSNGTNVIVYENNDTNAQRWYIRYNNFGYGLVPKSCTSSSVDLYGENLADDTNVQQYTWNASYAQTFSIDYTSISPSATKYFNGNRYEYYDHTMTWNQAYRVCEKKGGHLVTITSQEENDFVFDLANDFENNYCWLGGTDFASEGNWYWVNSEKFGYSNWRSGEPNDDSNGTEEYMHMHVLNDYAGQWNDLPNDINNVFGFICEYEGDANETLYTPTETIDNGEIKYEIYDYSVDWATAEKICEAKGGHLVVIDSQEENEVIYNAIKDNSKSEYWMGITDVESEGIWTNFKGDILGYTNWLTNEPSNDFNTEEYALIRSADGLWADLKSFAYSYHSIGFICEYELTQGDVNNDGEISLVDAISVLRHIINVELLSDEAQAVADMDQDGEISLLDAIMIQKLLLNS